MKIIFWGAVAVFVLVWTGGAVLLAEAVQWVAQWISSGSQSTLEATAKNLVLPIWLAPWFDPSSIVQVLKTLQDVLANFYSVLPTMGMVVAWLIPAIWITWGVGIVIVIGMIVAGVVFYKK